MKLVVWLLLLLLGLLLVRLPLEDPQLRSTLTFNLKSLAANKADGEERELSQQTLDTLHGPGQTTNKNTQCSLCLRLDRFCGCCSCCLLVNKFRSKIFLGILASAQQQ